MEGKCHDGPAFNTLSGNSNSSLHGDMVYIGVQFTAMRVLANKMIDIFELFTKGNEARCR